MLRFAAPLGVVLFVSACCTPSPPPPPPFVDPCSVRICDDGGGFPFDGSVPPILPADLCGTSEFGAACEHSCARPGLTCYEERSVSTSIDGPEGPVVLDVLGFPNGMCSRSCGNDTDCGDCARCVPYVLAGRARLRGLVGTSGVCRPRCELGCPEGTACDPELGACVEACASDEQCRFRTVDSDGDGIEDTLDYEADTELVCLAGICAAPGLAIGDQCDDDTWCEPGFACLEGDSPRLGRCGRAGCSPGTCGAGAACMPDADGRLICAPSCVIGAEAPGRQLGPAGGGDGCDEGSACLWTGALDALGVPEGACVTSNYNLVVTPNVGAPCTSSNECWSPYGRGACLRVTEGGSYGVCAVRECQPGGTGLRPAVPADPALCDPAAGQECLALGASTACLVTCVAPSECLPGWACVRPVGGADDASRVCSPDCAADADCAAPSRCLAVDASPCDAGTDFGCACG